MIDEASADVAPAVAPAPPAPVETGFTYGSPTAYSTPRPDPYAPAQPPQYAPPPQYTPAPAPQYAPAQQYYGSPYVAPAYGSVPPPPGVNGLAIAGLIVSAAGWIVLSFLAPIAGIILSAFGLAAAKRRAESGHPSPGRGIALAGIIVGIVVAVIGLIAIVAYIGFFLSIGSTY